MEYIKPILIFYFTNEYSVHQILTKWKYNSNKLMNTLLFSYYLIEPIIWCINHFLGIHSITIEIKNFKCYISAESIIWHTVACPAGRPDITL